MSQHRWVVAAVVLVLGMGLVTAGYWMRHGIHIENPVHVVPADGSWHRVGTVRGRWLSPVRSDALTARGAVVRLRDASAGVTVSVLAPVTPGKAVVRVEGGSRNVAFPLLFEASATDSFGDGFPDWSRLHDSSDRLAFRRWFATLAENTADVRDDELPREITDCASLLRYAYRNALVVHDDRWYKQFSPEAMPSAPSVAQWSYPNTPLGAGLFRVRLGPFVASDLSDGSFAQFADAKTLYQRNAFLVGRRVSAARPGDLIFYRVLETDSQYHSMIVVGERGEWVVYHTGQIDGHRGEMRRVLMADLLRHPDPKWRPEPGNPNFLGIYRWNILRED